MEPPELPEPALRTDIMTRKPENTSRSPIASGPLHASFTKISPRQFVTLDPNESCTHSAQPVRPEFNKDRIRTFRYRPIHLFKPRTSPCGFSDEYKKRIAESYGGVSPVRQLAQVFYTQIVP